MISYVERGPVDDVALSQLHAAAFAETPRLVRWGDRLARHSLTWFCALDGARLTGFVNVAWDGDRHAFLLDVVVSPPRQREGIGTELVRRAVAAAAEAGCTWLHTDPADHLTPFFANCAVPRTLRLHT